MSQKGDNYAWKVDKPSKMMLSLCMASSTSERPVRRSAACCILGRTDWQVRAPSLSTHLHEGNQALHALSRH